MLLPEWLFLAPLQAFDAIEYFCGMAHVSRCLRNAGHAVASLDIILGDPKPGKQNAMDILTDAGMAFLGGAIQYHEGSYGGFGWAQS